MRTPDIASKRRRQQRHNDKPRVHWPTVCHKHNQPSFEILDDRTGIDTSAEKHGLFALTSKVQGHPDKDPTQPQEDEKGVRDKTHYE